MSGNLSTDRLAKHITLPDFTADACNYCHCAGVSIPSAIAIGFKPSAIATRALAIEPAIGSLAQSRTNKRVNLSDFTGTFFRLLKAA
ncbi:hypothetical protein [Microcoleus sp. D3_18a_C4]|uniref:hypothetical protein n=1 Tax=unclassified Microcoleus TaxID=2642155 RepID=UPI002FD175D7